MNERNLVSKAYRDVDPDTMILRDHLALGRTVLANERTALAYLRTAVALVITGLLLIRFSEESAIPYTGLVGWLMLAAATVVILVILRMRMIRRWSMPGRMPREGKPVLEVRDRRHWRASIGGMCRAASFLIARPPSWPYLCYNARTTTRRGRGLA
jgi:putative membrane protein